MADSRQGPRPRAVFAFSVCWAAAGWARCRALDLTLNQPVALKSIAHAAQASEAVLARFRNEERIARQVSHPRRE